MIASNGVVMYAYNDVTHDSRVLREAATLAATGRSVTLIGVQLPGATTPLREERDGFTIIRAPLPPANVWWFTFLRSPWRSVATGLDAARRHLGRPWPQPLRALAIVGAFAVLSPYILVRTAWYAVVNRLLGRPYSFGGLQYIRAWRAQRLGWARAAHAMAPPARVHHGHDMEALPAAAMSARRDGSRYVYDSHEIFVAWGPILDIPAWIRWLFARWERRLARGAAALVTVNRSIASELERRFGLSDAVVVHNCPPRWDPPDPPEDRIRAALELPPDTPIVLCHGGFLPGRGLEQTAAAMLQPGLEHAHLVFMGYRIHVIEPILSLPRLRGRVHHLPPVAPGDVAAWVAGADVDVMSILPIDLNSRLSTPNKLFESLAAGVPVVSSDFPERRRIVLEDPLGPLGALCDPHDPASIAVAIRSILEQPPEARRELRERCLRAAHERWNWESESARLVALYERLLADQEDMITEPASSKIAARTP